MLRLDLSKRVRYPVSDLLESLRAALADRYAVERELGRGGMATVFLAEDLKHRRAVAIKVLHGELAQALGAERFLREIEIAARLQHPHILPLYDSGSTDGLLYYVMPYVEGESLRERLTREKQLPLEDVLRITTEVAGALAYAHSRGIVHRDVKPENILLSGGSAVVADFGIARAVTAAEERHHLTQTGTILGTPAYVSPEQAAGSNEIDGRSDQYSLACMTYEMLVGDPPFTGSTPQAILARHSLDAVSPPSIVRATIPEAFEDALLRALAKLPADRFPTTTLFAEALATPSRVTGAQRWSGTRFPAPPRWSWRRGLLWGVGATVGVAAIWGLARSLRGGAAGSAGAAAGPDPRGIAVLYFEDLSPGRRLRYLADGLTEALIEQLAQVPVLRVISRNGVAPYRSPDVQPDSVARALQVGTIVRGTVEPTRDGYRVSVRLIDGASGADLGERASFEQPAGAVLAIRDSLAQRVAAFLRGRVGEQVELRATRSGTSNVAAWSEFEQGERERKDAEARLDRDSMAAAVAGFARADSLFAQAATTDPAWVEPVVQRGVLAHRRARLTNDRAELARWLALALSYADQALERSPGYPRALELRGTARYTSWLVELTPDSAARAGLLAGARRDLEAATQADPTLASAFSTLSHLYYQTEDVPAAVLAARRAYEEDAYLAVASDVLWRLFIGSYDLQQFTQATRWCEAGAARFPRHYRFAECQLWLMTTPAREADPRAAWRLYTKLDSVTPAPRKPLELHRAAMIVGAILARAGLADSARHVLVAAREDPTTDPQLELVSLEAFARTLLGERDEAIDLLKRYVAANPAHAFKRGGDISWWWRDLRTDPRFAQLERAGR
ncbi:MAG TPA: serine/threonine-protein kinase [Gemmatimonadales bacterium]|nr:serine/threonine-protein kinase [Gemmatimonadales bacterium]